MTDSNASSPPADTAVRPPTAVALAAALLVSGVAAILAGVLLIGHTSQLESLVRKNAPPVSSQQIGALSQSAGSAVTAALKPGPVAATTAGTVGAKVAAVLADTKALPSKNVTDDERKTQQTQAEAAVTAALKGRSTVSAADVTTIASSVQATVGKDLTALAAKRESDIKSNAKGLPKSYMIQGVVVLLALSFIAFGAYAGRFWSRWAVIILFVLCTFIGAPAGAFSLQVLSLDAPGGFKSAIGVSSLAMILAVVLSLLKPTRAWFEAHRPTPVPGQPQRRGLFAPRVPPAGASTGGARTTSSRPAKSPAAGGVIRTSKKISVTKGGDPAAGSTESGPVASAAPGSPSAPAGSAGQAGSAEQAGKPARPRTASKSRRTES